MSELPFFFGNGFLNVPKHSQAHRDVFHFTQLFQPVRIPAVAFLISDGKFIKAVAKLQ